MTNPCSDSEAQELFQREMDYTENYHGWYQVSIDTTPEMKEHIKSMEGIPSRTHYISNVDEKVHVSLNEFDDGRDVTLQFNSRREVWTLLRGTSEIRIGTLPQEQADNWYYMPTTVRRILSQFKLDTGRKPAHISAMRQDDLICFDLSLFASVEDKAACTSAHGCSVPDVMVFWVDASHRLVRMEIQQPEYRYTSHFTYDLPPVREIYDLGISRDTPLADLRVPQDQSGRNLVELCARLENRVAQDFGDYTALSVSYDANPDGSASRDSGFATLYAIKGDKYLVIGYRLRRTDQPGRRPTYNAVFKDLPYTWPVVSIDELLPTLLVSFPNQFTVWNGKKGWSGSFDQNKRELTVQNMHEYSGNRIHHRCLAGEFWPQYAWFGSEAHTKRIFLQDANRPEIVGIKAQTFAHARGREDDGGSEITYWIDASHADVPVEINSLQKYETGELSHGTHAIYDTFTQLPSGQWYPAHWRRVITSRNPPEYKRIESDTEYRLQIHPTLALGDEWFVDPGKRLPKHPGDVPEN